MIASRRKSFIKSVAWRVLGVIILATITYFFTRKWIQTGLITIIHHTAFLFIFYFHERIWIKVHWISKWKHIAKTITYELVLGNLVLGTITWLITGDWKKVTAITLAYIGIKLIIYPLYDWIWDRKRVVYAYLCGDIIHIGHLNFLEEGKKKGDYLIAGVLTDKAVMEKKPKPIMGEKERLKTISAIKYVNRAVLQDDYSPLDNVKKYKPDILIESDSHKEMPANEYVRSYGGKVVVIPYYKFQSSTNIKKEICKRLRW